MDLKKTFGKRIKELRNKKKMTQFELAEAIQIDEKHLSHIETGRSFPKANLIEKMAEILEEDLNSLFDFPVEKSREEILNIIIQKLYKMDEKELQKIHKLICLYTK